MTNNIINNTKNFKNKLEVIKKGSLSNFFVLSDFDGTLTKVFIPRKTSALLNFYFKKRKLFNYLTEGYSQKAKALYEKYNPIAHNLKLSFPCRAKKNGRMVEDSL